MLSHLDLKFHIYNNELRIYLYKIFMLSLEIDEKVKKKIKIKNNEIYSDDKKLLQNLLNLINEEINNYVFNTITKRKTKFVSKESNIPLIGHNSFGITDRNTNWLEIKSITGCNLDCIFCSVDETRRVNDFVVESEYLIEETNKLVEKKHYPVTIIINAHGEPLLYFKLEEVIKRLKENKKIERIIAITNGTLLTEERIKSLEEAGLDQINISISAVDKEIGRYLMNKQSYNTDEILNRILYLKNNTKIDVVITPVFLPKINENEIEKLVKFAAKHNITIAIQNFLEYKTGKRPTKQISFDEFYMILKEWENKYKINLTNFKFDIKKDKVLDMPFRRNQIITAKIVSFGRFKNEKLAIVPGIPRVISLLNSKKEEGEYQKAKIIRVKHNIIVAEAI